MLAMCLLVRGAAAFTARSRVREPDQATE